MRWTGSGLLEEDSWPSEEDDADDESTEEALLREGTTLGALRRLLAEPGGVRRGSAIRRRRCDRGSPGVVATDGMVVARAARARFFSREVVGRALRAAAVNGGGGGGGRR